MSKASEPSGLADSGRAVWASVTDLYELRVDELVVLEKACRASDRIAQMESELEGSTFMVKGSMGQPVVNPLVAEIRAHEALVQRLLGSLKLPDDPKGGAEEKPRSAQARAAAQSRWAAAHGKGA